MTCRLQEVRPRVLSALAAPMAQVIAVTAPAALALFGVSFHESFHADSRQRPMTVTDRSGQNPPAATPQLDMVRQASRTACCTAESGRKWNQGGAVARHRWPGACVGLCLRPGRRAPGPRIPPVPAGPRADGCLHPVAARPGGWRAVCW